MVSNMEKKINLTSKQQEALSEIDHNLQIIACAGSGKTEVITRRIFYRANRTSNRKI